MAWRAKDLLRLCEIPRDSATVGFVHGGGRPLDFDIENALAELQAHGWIERDAATQRWALTDAGRGARHEFDNWEFFVESAYRLTGIGRVAAGQVRHGVMSPGDWFEVSDRDARGRITSIEPIRRVGGAQAIAIRTDVIVRRGETLVAAED